MAIESLSFLGSVGSRVGSRGASTDPAFTMSLVSALLQLSSEEAGFLEEISGDLLMTTKGKAALVVCVLEEELLCIACTQGASYRLIKVNGSLPSASAGQHRGIKILCTVQMVVFPEHCLILAVTPKLGMSYHFYFSGGKAETESNAEISKIMTVSHLAMCD